MNNIEFEIANAESRTKRAARLRKRRRKRNAMVLLAGLSAFAATVLVGSNLIGTTYSLYTAHASLTGDFKAGEFCKGGDDDDDHRDKTVAEALYQEPAAAKAKDDKQPHDNRDDCRHPDRGSDDQGHNGHHDVAEEAPAKPDTPAKPEAPAKPEQPATAADPVLRPDHRLPMEDGTLDGVTLEIPPRQSLL